MSAPRSLLRIVFLVSGGGGNLRAVQRVATEFPQCGFQLAGVIGDRESPATTWSRARGLPTTVVAYSRDDCEALNRELNRLAPEGVVTTFHRILSPQTLRLAEGRFINLHYSELPRFAGLIGEAPVRAALAAGDSFIGTTVHRVIEQVDAGEVLGRTRTPVVVGEPFAALMTRIFRAGAWNLVNVLTREARGELPAELGAGGQFTPEFWRSFE